MKVELMKSLEVEESDEITISFFSMTINNEDLVGINLDWMTLISESTIIFGWILELKNSLWVSLLNSLVERLLGIVVCELLGT